MPLISEHSFWFHASHDGTGYVAPYSDVSRDFHVAYPRAPGVIGVKVGLTSFTGTVSGPGGATIGISEYAPPGGGARVVLADPQDWLDTAWGIDNFTIRVSIYRGTIKGWALVQVWE